MTWLIVALGISVLSFIGLQSHSPTTRLETVNPASPLLEQGTLSEQVTLSSASNRVSPPLQLNRAKTSLNSSGLVFGCFYFKVDFYTGRETPELKWIQVFLRSLLRHSPSAEVILFLDPLSLKKLVELEPQLASLPSMHWIEINGAGAQGAILNQSWAKGIKNGANNFRFALYHDWLEKNSDRFDDKFPVLMSDLTDVCFQDDPFKCAPSSTHPWIKFTLEKESKTFANEKYNRRWMSCYGPGVLSELKRRQAPISCAGVTLASYRGAILYTAAQLKQIATPELLTCSIQKIGAALDQATHNYLLHMGGLSDIEIFRSLHSEACTFHGNFGNPRFKELSVNGKLTTVVTNGSGVVYPIVHQYTSNRHPSIMRTMEREYL